MKVATVVVIEHISKEAIETTVSSHKCVNVPLTTKEGDNGEDSLIWEMSEMH